MKQKRFVSMIGALVVILGAVAFITGCPQAKENAVGVQFPDDLRNTSWNHKTEIGGMVMNSITLEFGTNALKYTTNGIVTNYTIISATKGGKIEISAGAGTKVVLCESYSISGSSLTMSGGLHSIELDYTKQ